MKKLSFILASVVLVAFGILAVAGANLTYDNSMGMGQMDEMKGAQNHNPCKIMQESLFCDMSPLAHIKHFQNMFLAIFPASLLLTLATLFILLAVTKLRQRGIALFEKLLHAFLRFRDALLPRFSFQTSSRLFHPVLRSFTKIHQRLYA